MDEARSAPVRSRKKLHGKGTNTQITHKQTLRLLDQLGPVGRVGENVMKEKYITHYTLHILIQFNFCNFDK